MAKGTYELIASNTVSGSSTTTVTFDTIPQYYTDLRIVITSKINDVNPYYVFNRLRFNGNTSLVYAQSGMYNFYGNYTPQSTGGKDDNFTSNSSFGSSTSYTTAFLDIFNYSSSTTFKGYIGRDGGPGPAPFAYYVKQGCWMNTNPITTLSIDTNGSWILTAGSYYSLYGIRSE